MPKETFNLPEYFALHSYLSALLCGAFVLLPRSTPWFLGDEAIQSSSTDRPEYAFLTPLTARPLITMVWDISGMLLCMSWWGSIMRRWSQVSTKRTAVTVANEEEMTKRSNRDRQMLNRIGECASATAAGSALLFVLITTLGAPLDSNHLHTALLSIHIAILTVWPTVHALGIPSIYDSGTYARFRMTRLFCEFRPETPLERALVYPVIGTLVGAWCGAVPIPLDWDRPWQSYPLTPTVASILGFIAGGFVSWLHSALIDTADEVLLQQKQKQSLDAAVTKKKKKAMKRT
ncbi:hypothetical protein I302_102721 [Kwoniella bestiolae CBS 10118]|uniref:Phosphatidylinositol glycan, class F n=1 Tax=Kwoniella bestiolae CBS 10118 TaxID=1296100 RepID=A0A1B9GG17_9TREE|nr:hypothetical protein I302_01414 [Kwoniella bestiolae CBS 10118]OCF29901.1 hypothetical protein I302_01414 [Kwoniella bestiolae CBS 10118]